MADLTTEQTERLAALQARTDLSIDEVEERDRLRALRDDAPITEYTEAAPAVRPDGLSDEEAARLEELKAKAPSPTVAQSQVRSEAEERELFALSAAQKAADEYKAPPVVEPTPRQRYAALDAKKPHPSAVIVEDVRTEYEENQWRLLGERFAAADRLVALQAQITRTPEKDAEMAQLQATVRPEDMPA